MKFIVRRASVWTEETPPCEEARRDSIIYVDTRRFHTPEEFDQACAKTQGKWLLSGTNHRINKHGHIARDRGTIDVWYVEIHTLNELMEFCEKYGSVIVGEYWHNDEYMELLIYDDYIE